MGFYNFEQGILSKIDAWEPVTIPKADITFASYGQPQPASKSVRLVVGFLYDTEGEGDRASIGETYKQRVPCRVVMDLYATPSIERKKVIDLFNELEIYARRQIKQARQFDFLSGYIQETEESLFTLTALINIDKSVTV